MLGRSPPIGWCGASALMAQIGAWGEPRPRPMFSAGQHECVQGPGRMHGKKRTAAQGLKGKATAENKVGS